MSDTSGRQAQIAALTSTLMIAQQVAGKAARDALFLTSFHLTSLPYAMASGALLSLAAVWVTARSLAKHSPAALAPLLFVANAAAFGLEAGVQMSSPRLAAGLLYLHTAFLGPVTITTFWSLVNERFDPHTAKRAVARIAAGGTLGGVLGALAAWRLATVLRPEGILLGLAAVNAVGAVGAVFSSNRNEPAVHANDAGPSAGLAGSLRIVQGAPFLRNLALLVAIGALTSALLDYIFSREAVAHFGRGQALFSFFSLFWLAVGLLTFLVQMSLGRVAIEKLSLALNIAVLPGIILLGGTFGLAVPGLMSSALLRGGEAVQRNSLFRSAYELLYTPIAEARKRTTKSLIDIGFDRLGTVLGSGMVLLALRFFGRYEESVLLGGVVVFALATFPVTRKLHLGYVEALQESLKEAAKKLEPAPVSQRLSNDLGHGPPAREKLIERLEQLQPGGLSALMDPDAADAQGTSPNEEAEATAALSRRFGLANDLLSKEPGRIRRALEQLEPGDPGIVCAVALLGNRALAQSAADALAKIAPGITGQLIDALLDPTTSYRVRRRLPRVLRSCASQRSAQGLLLGLGDERFEVRYECGRALLHITDANPQLEISQKEVLASIQKEVSLAEQMVGEEPADADDDDRLPEDQTRLLDGLKLDRINRSLEHVFTLLCLHQEREPLRIAFRALHTQDEKFRGTALEYLSTVLPEEVRDIVWPYFGKGAPLPIARPATELLLELSRADRP